ncbi:hypothetical protein LJC11_01930 [Bacteroidales bacterium OttesenSCG-928-I21]|nr:hypothetical protein [Bacteroidales bacterium OttesenSCG-928-I21]
MFVGEYTGKLDNKGRIIFPSPLKRQIPTDKPVSFVIKSDIYEKCLNLYHTSEWDIQTKALKKRLNLFNKQHADFLREYYRGTAEIFLDTNNRILIPKRLLDYIDGGNELVFAAQGSKIEIWSKEKYENKQPTNEEYADLANNILGGEYGIFNEE